MSKTVSPRWLPCRKGLEEKFIASEQMGVQANQPAIEQNNSSKLHADLCSILEVFL